MGDRNLDPDFSSTISIKANYNSRVSEKKETLVFEFCSYMSRCKRRLCSCVPVNCNFITFSVQIFLIPTIDFITALIFHTTTLCCFRKISVSIVFEIVFWACLNLNDATFDLSNGRVVDELFRCRYLS